MKILYFDCFCGASGDMVVGALLDAGASFETLRKGLDSLGVPGYRITAQKIQKHGVGATHFRVEVAEPEKQPHRHLRHIVEIINKGDLPDSVKQASLQTFQRIAECEAEIHGTTIERIHFHEVGAIDSIVDVVGAHLALHDLGVDRICASPLHVGAGTVQCAHGVMPVPAPATAMLLRGAPSYGGEVQGELVTPTGAALISQVAQSYGPMPVMSIQAVGYGSGTRELADRPNVLRVLIGEGSDDLQKTEPIVVLEANIDDMNPELLPALIQDALHQGARDAFITPVLGKKGRPAHLLTVLCAEAELGPVVRALFQGSTTLGVRIHREERICLPREWKQVATPWGPVRAKIGIFDGHTSVAAPEFEDCRTCAESAGVPVRAVYEAALAAAVKGEFTHG